MSDLAIIVYLTPNPKKKKKEKEQKKNTLGFFKPPLMSFKTVSKLVKTRYQSISMPGSSSIRQFPITEL